METASFGQGRRVEAPDPVSACGACGVPLGTARTASRLSARGTTPACVSPADQTETLDGAQEPALVDPKSKLQQAAEEGPPPVSERPPRTSSCVFQHLGVGIQQPKTWNRTPRPPHPALAWGTARFQEGGTPTSRVFVAFHPHGATATSGQHGQAAGQFYLLEKKT